MNVANKLLETIHHQVMKEMYKTDEIENNTSIRQSVNNLINDEPSHSKKIHSKVNSDRLPFQARTVQSIDQVRLPSRLASEIGQRKRPIELVDLTCDSVPQHFDRKFFNLVSTHN